MPNTTQSKSDCLKVFLVVRFRDPRQTVRLRTTYCEALSTIGRCEASSITEIKIEFIGA